MHDIKLINNLQNRRISEQGRERNARYTSVERDHERKARDIFRLALVYRALLSAPLLTYSTG